MTQKTRIKVYGKTYTIKTDSPAVDPQDLAEFVDTQMQSLARGAAKTSTLDLAVLTALNIAQELFSLRREYEAFRQEQTRQEAGKNARLEALCRQMETVLS